MVEPVYRSMVDTFVNVEFHLVADIVSCPFGSVIKGLAIMVAFVLICQTTSIAHASMDGKERLAIQVRTIGFTHFV